MSLLFSYGKLTFEEVRQFLQETDNEFPTPLSARVDIDAYAKKLSEFSDFSICRDGESIVGMISCYTNRPPIGYISNVCIMSAYQGLRVFSELFHRLVDKVKGNGIKIIRLEVDSNNTKAKDVYIHCGFSVVACDNKCILELNL